MTIFKYHYSAVELFAKEILQLRWKYDEQQKAERHILLLLRDFIIEAEE